MRVRLREATFPLLKDPRVCYSLSQGSKVDVLVGILLVPLLRPRKVS